MPADQMINLVIQILVAIGGIAGLVSLLTVRAQKRKLISESGKTDAEADAAFASAYRLRAEAQVSLIDPYEGIVDRMEEELAKANEKIDRLTSYVEALVQIIRDAGLSVPPMPRPPAAPTRGGNRGGRRRQPPLP